MGSKQTYGSLGRTDLHMYDPNDLTIVVDPKHPLFDERANLPPNRKYIESIKKVGVLEPVLARVNGQDDEGKTIVEIMEGRQRTRCCAIANEELVKEGKDPHRVPVILKRVDGTVAEDIMIMGNEIRTNDGPLVRARKLQRYLDRGRSVEEAMTAFGIKSKTTIQGLLTLLDLEEKVQQEVEKGIVGVGLAKKLALFPREQQMEELRKVMEAGGYVDPKTNGHTNGSNGTNGTTVDTTNGSYDDPAVREAVLGAPDPRLDAPDEEEDTAHVPLAEHTAPVDATKGTRSAKKAQKEALKKQMGKRGAKIRQRSVKTAPQLKEAREALKGSRSDVSAVFDAALAWVLGEEDALSGYAAIAKRLEGI